MLPSITSTDKSVCATRILPYSQILLNGRAGVAQTLFSLLWHDAAADIANRLIAAPPNTHLPRTAPSRLPRGSASASVLLHPSPRRLRVSRAIGSRRNLCWWRGPRRRAPARIARRDLSPTTPR